ncbi:MAG: hypothetical protein IKK58_00675 [Clostridia bacterium]|nr:hypothetical protein [Clostridia bacterium]
MRILKRIGKILLILLIVIAVLLGGFALAQPIIYSDYYAGARCEFEAAGLGAGMVPQGLAYDNGLFYQCGYMADNKSPSRIYITDDNSERYVELLDKDGGSYCGHTGGIAVGERYVWLSNDGDTAEDNCVWVINKAELLDPATKQIRLDKRFHPEVRGATCYVADGLLYVGEYYDGGRYSTKESHRFNTPDGEHNALICAYTVDETAEYGIVSEVPVKAYSVRDNLQGVAIGDSGEIILSCSRAIMSSKLEFYLPNDQPDATLDISGSQVPIYFLDSRNLTHEVSMPPMSEGIVNKDGRVYVLYESACTKYIYGILTRGKDVYSYKPIY